MFKKDSVRTDGTLGKPIVYLTGETNEGFFIASCHNGFLTYFDMNDPIWKEEIIEMTPNFKQK